uniref:(northern house mosquito) hypothetical protein n=1 Tax=Culex pipiens TaxID=7175 RepID=A0A8D8ETE4_CULPI
MSSSLRSSELIRRIFKFGQSFSITLKTFASLSPLKTNFSIRVSRKSTSEQPSTVSSMTSFHDVSFRLGVSRNMVSSAPSTHLHSQKLISVSPGPIRTHQEPTSKIRAFPKKIFEAAGNRNCGV